MIRVTQKPVTQEVRTVSIADSDAAFAILNDYHSIGASVFNQRYGARDTSEADVLAYAAAQYLLGYLSPPRTVAAALGVTVTP